MLQEILLELCLVRELQCLLNGESQFKGGPFATTFLLFLYRVLIVGVESLVFVHFKLVNFAIG